MLKQASGITIYLLVGLVSLPLHNYGVDLYRTHIAAFTARDAVSGGAVYLAYNMLIVTNVIIFWVSHLYAKLALIGAMTIILLWILLPYYPVRAMAYSSFTVGVSLVALITRAGVDRLLSTISHQLAK